ncbi:MAG: lipoprotein signal peptidase [Flavobacteriaceae bacterium]
MNTRTVPLLIFLVLFLDQAVKFYIKTNFVLGEAIDVFSWFQIVFIENEGAAWGAKLSDWLPISDRSGKLALTLFRIVAIGGISYWTYSSLKKRANSWLLTAQSLILAGALGNIIDSVFYGLLFTDSWGQIAQFLPPVGYEGFFHGKVVDMIYFPLIDTTWPEWVPIKGGSPFRFFDAVFNIADVSISTGVGILLVFGSKAFPKEAENNPESAQQQPS